MRNTGLVDLHTGSFSTIGSTSRWRPRSHWRASDPWRCSSVRYKESMLMRRHLPVWTEQVHTGERPESDNWKVEVEMAETSSLWDAWTVNNQQQVWFKRAARDRWCSHKCVSVRAWDERGREIGKRATERYTRRVTSLSSSSSPLTSCLCSAFPPHWTLSRKSMAGETHGFIRLQRCGMKANFQQNNIQHVVFDLSAALHNNP